MVRRVTAFRSVTIGRNGKKPLPPFGERGCGAQVARSIGLDRYWMTGGDAVQALVSVALPQPPSATLPVPWTFGAGEAVPAISG